MSEFLIDSDGCLNLLSMTLLNRFITVAYERTGAPEPTLRIISNPVQHDVARMMMREFFLCPKCGERRDCAVADDPFTNPLKRIAAWDLDSSMPRDEIRIEHPKGVCRIKKLAIYAQYLEEADSIAYDADLRRHLNAD